MSEQLSEVMQALAAITPVFLSIPLIQAIVKMFREAGVPDRFVPFVALILGGALGLIVAYIATVLTVYNPAILYICGIFLGLQAGAGAVGFYEAAKKTDIVPEEVDPAA